MEINFSEFALPATIFIKIHLCQKFFLLLDHLSNHKTVEDLESTISQLIFFLHKL